MGHTGQNNIRLVVDDEEDLYAAFSPEDEFSEAVKFYIRSKIANEFDRQSINLTVISRQPVNEERFRAAVSNWIRDEKALFKKTERETILTLIGSLIFGSILIILSIILEKKISVLKYTIIPVMGSLALSKAASIMVMGMPVIKAKRAIFGEIEKKSVITFECVNDKQEIPREGNRSTGTGGKS